VTALPYQTSENHLLIGALCVAGTNRISNNLLINPSSYSTSPELLWMPFFNMAGGFGEHLLFLSKLESQGAREQGIGGLRWGLKARDNCSRCVWLLLSYC
jgi:hypothetical protein